MGNVGKSNENRKCLWLCGCQRHWICGEWLGEYEFEAVKNLVSMGFKLL